MKLDTSKLSMVIDFYEFLAGDVLHKLRAKYPEDEFELSIAEEYLMRPSYEDFLEQKVQEEIENLTQWMVKQYYNAVEN